MIRPRPLKRLMRDREQAPLVPTPHSLPAWVHQRTLSTAAEFQPA